MFVTFFQHVDSLGELVDVLLERLHINRVEGCGRPLIHQASPLLQWLPQQPTQGQVTFDLGQVCLDILGAGVRLLVHHHNAAKETTQSSQQAEYIALLFFFFLKQILWVRWSDTDFKPYRCQQTKREQRGIKNRQQRGWKIHSHSTTIEASNSSISLLKIPKETVHYHLPVREHDTFFHN